jgi:hypothetical protein
MTQKDPVAKQVLDVNKIKNHSTKDIEMSLSLW